MGKNNMQKQLSQVYKQIQETSEAAMIKALIRGITLAKKYMQERWFDVYEPSDYERTGEILDALNIKCKMVGNRIIGEITIPDTYHKEQSQAFVDVRTFDEIHEWFATGQANGRSRHGKNLDAMKYTYDQLIVCKEAIGIIEKTLKQAGFNVDLGGSATTSKVWEEDYDF